MNAETVSSAVRFYVRAMRVLGVLYAGGALMFLFLPGLAFWFLDVIPNLAGWRTLPVSSEVFWTPLAASMMTMLTVLAFGAAADPKNWMLAWVHIVSKGCSSFGYLYLFLVKDHLFGYIAGTITDLPIFCFVLWMTLRARRA